MKRTGILTIVSGILIIAFVWGIAGNRLRVIEDPTGAGISVSKAHPLYWQYKGKEILLLGGSVEDNLFQINSLDEQLDLLKSCGGNYVRNTMSSRDEGNVWPFKMNEDGRYNLDEWNEEYWIRLERFLRATSERDIIVQMEIWATFDFYRDPWLHNPFNPVNNVNYDSARVKLKTRVPSHPIYTDNNFFRSVPGQMSLLRLLEYQQKYVDKILAHTLKYDNLLYCMDNETSVTSDWGKFWANYIKKKGRAAGKDLQTTEMWDPWDLNHVVHRETMDNPDLFSFVDISQNNHNSGETHWLNGLKQIEHLSHIGASRPCNNVKVYGNDGGPHQTTQNGIACFIRNVMLGSAAVRFHRPPTGQGINEIAQHVIKSMRLIADEMDFFNGQPFDQAIVEKETDEAYCRGIRGKEYLVYFPDGGEVKIDLDLGGKSGSIRWINPLKSEWEHEGKIKPGQAITLTSPGEGNWLALIH